MSFSDQSVLFSKTAIRARVVNFTAVAALAACAVCSASIAKAASGDQNDFVIMRYLAPVSPDWTDDWSSTSFANRFAQPQNSIMQDIIERLAYTVLASLPQPMEITPAGPPILGMASTYNPNDANDRDAGNLETASGELYNANDWTAAIRTDLRTQFGGVRFGKNYRPTFALVQTDDKQAIVRINDIGPLLPGRIIDLNERAMRFFDPDLQRGLLHNIRVTPLAGQDWIAGPVIEDQSINVAGVFER